MLNTEEKDTDEGMGRRSGDADVCSGMKEVPWGDLTSI